MQNNIVNMPNDMVAIICQKNDNKNNTYTLVPKEVTIGKINKNKFFVSDNGDYNVPDVCDNRYFSEENVENYYVYADSLENIKEKYPGIEDVSILLYYYLKDIASEFHLLLNDNGNIHLYRIPYGAISKEIGGDQLKKYVAPEKVQVPSILVPKEKTIEHIDSIGLEKYLKERIFENDDIIEDIVTTIAMNYRAKKKEDVEAILSIGPTGSGKTATYEAISEYCNIPLTIYDCNLLTAAGYVGKDLDDVFREVYLKCDKNIKKAEKSILAFDEIDKIAIRGNDVKDAAVQYSLLKVLDGHSYSFETVRNGPRAAIDTSFMTIAGLGAFPDIFAKKEKEGNLGFSSSKFTSDFEITDKDLIKFGMIGELIGRFPNTHIYKKLLRDDIKRIILESKNSPLLRKQERYLVEFNTIIIYNEAFIDALVDEAYKLQAGGRSLNKIIAYVFKKADRALNRELERGNLSSTRKLVLTQDTVHNNRLFQL